MKKTLTLIAGVALAASTYAATASFEIVQCFMSGVNPNSYLTKNGNVTSGTCDAQLAEAVQDTGGPGNQNLYNVAPVGQGVQFTFVKYSSS